MKTVGLVLGSGGARGWAHIGAIRALEDANIRVHSIAGASIGALVGALYAAGELDDLEELVRAMDWKALISYFDVVFPSSGLLDGDRVYEMLSDHLQGLAIESAEIKFCCVATDLVSGQEVCLHTGPMVDAVRASISIPGIFTPFQKDGHWWGDGGVVNPLPVDVMREMNVDVVVAVNLNNRSGSSALGAAQTEVLSPNSSLLQAQPQESDPSDAESVAESVSDDACETESSETVAESGDDTESANAQPHDDDSTTDRHHDFQETSNSQAQERIATFFQQVQERYEVFQDRFQEKMENWMPQQKESMNIFDVIGISLNVMEQQVTQSKLNAYPPDILIEPALGEYGIFDFHKAEAIIEEGYRCMEELIPELQEKLSDDNSVSEFGSEAEQ
ncbi:MAG: patatin-like phospholipase family protein [Elainellaceae cyanobacterium]